MNGNETLIITGITIENLLTCFRGIVREELSKLSQIDPESENDLISSADAIKILSISKPTLYAIVERGELRAKKVGRSYRFKMTDIHKYLDK